MKIYFGNLLIARGIAYHESPSDFKITINKHVQTVALLRAETVKNFDRGNLKVEVFFRIIRKHSSSNEAIEYTLEHPTAIKSIHGSIRFITESEIDPITFCLQDSALQMIESSVTGNISNHKYLYVGSHFSKELVN
jgi:hypothetical protein